MVTKLENKKKHAKYYQNKGNNPTCDSTPCAYKNIFKYLLTYILIYMYLNLNQIINSI